jgi:hypothetical protein
MRVHVYIVSGLFLTAGLLLALVAVAGPSLLRSVSTEIASSGDDQAQLAAALVDFAGRNLTLGAALFALPTLIAAGGMLARQGWSRWVAIPLAAVVLVIFPAGTMLGGYALWVLLSTRFEFWFDGDPT